MNDFRSLKTKRRPSSLYSLFNGFRWRNTKFDTVESFPRIEARWEGVRIDKNHLGAYLEICGLKNGPHLPILYPFTLVYPLNLKILSQKEVPISMFAMLNVRNKTVLHRKMGMDETLDIVSQLRDVRVTPKGLEFDLVSSISSGNEVAWENAATFYVRGEYGEAEGFSPPKPEPISDAPTIHSYRLSERNSFRFARVLGDSNGIHYNKWYARLLGFKRDFAQPMMVVPRCLERLPDMEAALPLQLDLFLKGQLYYKEEVHLKYARSGNINRFDLLCDGNNRPCICGSYFSMG